MRSVSLAGEGALAHGPFVLRMSFFARSLRCWLDDFAEMTNRSRAPRDGRSVGTPGMIFARPGLSAFRLGLALCAGAAVLCTAPHPAGAQGRLEAQYEATL